MSKAVIPNLPPISSIKDPDTRVALESMWNAWRVRNGDVGDGTHKFLTAEDLKDAINGVDIKTITGAGGAGTLGEPGVGLPRTDWISPLLGKIDDYIQSSWLWVKLGERIDVLEMPEWFQGKFGAAIQTEVVQRQSGDTALAQQITTAVTNINNNIALVRDEIKTVSDLAGATASKVTTLQTEVAGVKATAQQSLTLSQTIDGQIKGAWTVKFDANGYVAGAGLGLEGKNGTMQSSFYVRADKFAIGNPEFPGVTPKIPFKVFTTPTSLPDGTVVQPGVYMDEAVVYKLTGTFIDAGTLNAGKIYTGSTWLDRVSGQAIRSQATAYFSLPGEGHYAVTPRWSGATRFYGPAYHPGSPLAQRVRSSTYGGSVTFIINASASADHYFSVWYRINGNDYTVAPVYEYTWLVGINYSTPWGETGSTNVYATTVGTSAVAPNLVGTQQVIDPEAGYTVLVTGQTGASVQSATQVGGGNVASTTQWNFIAKVVEYQNDFGTAAVAGSVTLNVPNSAWYVDFGVAVINESGGWTSYDGKNAYLRDAYMTVTAVNV